MQLYTIGTSDRTADGFYSELARRGIEMLVDVRSRPFSRLTWFRGSTMAVTTASRGLAYRWMGPSLGGDGDLTANPPAFVSGISELRSIASASLTAIFCAEGDPARCHRSYLVGRTLLEAGDDVISICRDGRDEPLDVTLKRSPTLRQSHQSASQNLLEKEKAVNEYPLLEYIIRVHTAL